MRISDWSSDVCSSDLACTAIAAAGGIAEALPFDVADAAAAAAAVAGLLERRRRLDILVNNVGQRDRRPIADFALDDLRRLLDVDLVAPFALSRLAAVPMAAAGRGRIVHVKIGRASGRDRVCLNV